MAIITWEDWEKWSFSSIGNKHGYGWSYLTAAGYGNGFYGQVSLGYPSGESRLIFDHFDEQSGESLGYYFDCSLYEESDI